MAAAYKYTKQDMEAATRLQIWQEVMRHSTRHDPGTGQQILPNPEGCAEVACRIFSKLHTGRVTEIALAKPRRK